jgi:hypothetical protein
MPDSPTVEILGVTPEMAETWLSRNPNNRNLRGQVIASYARDMASGSWVLNGETVKISSSGHLLDGQHRLSAVVQASVTVPMIVVSNIPPEVMATVDAGAKRTYADALKLQGEENTSVLAAVTRRAVLWSGGYRTKTGSMTPTALEMNEFLAAHRSLRTSAEVAVKIANRTLLPASIIGLCHWLFSDIEPDDAGWFLARLADGDGLAAEDPIAALRNRIVKMRVGGGRVNETEALALVIMAWNARRAGETRSKLQLPRGGLTSENFPEPR